MNYKYTRKEEQVEAFQLQKSRMWSMEDWPQWLKDALAAQKGEVGKLYLTDEVEGSSSGLNARVKRKYGLVTKDGIAAVREGNWLVKSVKSGEIWVEENHDFYRKYGKNSDDTDTESPLSYEDLQMIYQYVAATLHRDGKI